MPDGGDDRVSIPSNLSERVARVEEQIPALDRHMATRFDAVEERFDDIDKATELLAAGTERIRVRLAAESDKQEARDERADERQAQRQNEWRDTVTELAAGKADAKTVTGALDALRREMDARIVSVETNLTGKVDLLATAISDLRGEVIAMRSGGMGEQAGGDRQRANEDRTRQAIIGLVLAGIAVVSFVIARFA